MHPSGYHCDPKQPLPLAGLASQKNYMSLYLMCVYGESNNANWFREAWAKTGKKLDMGKSCVRFKKLEDLALDVIGETIKRMPAKKYIEYCESVVKNTNKPASKEADKAGKPEKPPKSGMSQVPARKRSRGQT